MSENPSSLGSPPPRWPITLVRTLAVVVLVQVLTQAALAGAFVTGKLTMLDLHSANGNLLVLTTTGLLLATILLARAGRGPRWPVVFSVVLWCLVAVQVGLGFARLVGPHIPLGVAVMSLISGFTWWSYSYRPRTGQSGRAPEVAEPEARV